jgi:hypothetical protein
MRRARALSFAFVGLYLTFGSVRAQESPPRPVAPPELSAGALAALESTPALDKVPEAATPLFGLRSRMTAVTPLDPEAAAGSFDVIDFDQNAANTGAFQVPADPAGAAGPNHVVAVVRSSIRWFTKDGTLQHDQSLRAFFANLPLTTTFNPRVVYDPHEGRFLVSTVERATPPNRSRLYLAVSDDSDPNGGWRIVEINSTLVIGTSSWADFPGLGVDEEAIYITANMFTFATNAFAGVRLWIIPKASFYSGGPVTLRLLNPITGIAAATTTQPAIMHPGAPAGLGTFLVQYGGLNNGVTVFLGMIRVDNPLGATSFATAFVPIGPAAQLDTLGAFPAATQLGTTRTIATGDRRVSQSPVWRDNNLYIAAPMLTPAAAGADGGDVTARWFRIDTSSLGAPVIADTGAVGGEDIAPDTHTFFPSVTADRNGNMAIGFAASGPNIHPGAYFATRRAGDAPGTTTPAGVLRAGLDPYVRAFSTSMTVASPWGNYSSVSLDPADESAFWVFNQYALTRGTILLNPPGLTHEDGRWGTAFGRFDAEPPVISNASVTPGTLWPPNHQMVDVTVSYTVTDNVGATCALSVSSNESLDGRGDGHTATDWVVIDATRVQLRAERAGTGDGRIYSIEIRCTDGTWTTTETVTVTAPKSQP